MTEQQADWYEIGDWKEGRVRSSAGVLLWVSLVFAVAFIGLGLPATLAVPEELEKGNTLVLIALLFPLVGLGALAVFFHAVISWYKFGAGEVLLDPIPGSIGGDFGGKIQTRIPYRSDLVVDITLTCQHQRTSGSGKNRSANTSVVWQREGIASARRYSRNGTELAFRFAVPAGLPESEASSDNYHSWMLQLDCSLPGVDFSRGFCVPLFETALPQLCSLDVPYARESNPLEKAPSGIVRITHSADAIEFHYPWYRRWSTALMLVIFGAVFVAAGLFAGRESGGMLFPLVFGGAGGLIALIGVYLIGNTLSTRVSKQGVDIVRRIYGIPLRRSAKREDISYLQRDIGSTAQSGRGHTVYFRIRVHTRDGRKITIADSLAGSRLADFVEDRIRRALDL